MIDIKGIVLRFSDSQPSVYTIEEHKEILSTHNSVFWGWWRKKDEHHHYEILKKLMDMVPFNVGFIDREDKKYYIGNCISIEIGKNEKDLISPSNTSLIPKYYIEQKCPAWFKLSSIKEISEDEFISCFNSIPYGDPTLFPYSENKIFDSKIHEIDLTKSIQMKGNSILHLSDLHFGKDHLYRDHENDTSPNYLIDILKPYLEKYKNDIGVVVVSGDYISRANTNRNYNSFTDALKFLRQLLQFLNLSKDNLIIIPGNHDMPLIDNNYEPNKDGNYTSWFRDFRYDIKEIEKEKELEFWSGFKTKNDWHLIFSYFNSAEYKYSYLANYGYIDSNRTKNIFDNLNSSLGLKEQEDFIKRRIINFCVIHHHIKLRLSANEVPKPDDTPNSDNKGVSVLLNSDIFEESAITAGIHFILHGHQHLPYVSSIGIIENGKRKNLNILSAGSAGSKIEKGFPELCPFNSFSIYTPFDNYLNVIIEKYNNKTHENPIEFKVPYL